MSLAVALAAVVAAAAVGAVGAGVTAGASAVRTKSASGGTGHSSPADTSAGCMLTR